MSTSIGKSILSNIREQLNLPEYQKIHWEGSFEEYLRIQQVDGTRLWFSSPSSTTYVVGPRLAHSIGATVSACTQEKKPNEMPATLPYA